MKTKLRSHRDQRVPAVLAELRGMGNERYRAGMAPSKLASSSAASTGASTVGP